MEPQEGSQVIITLDERWLSNLKAKLNEPHLKRWRIGPATICRVPKSIRDADPRSFQPRIISIGPYHRHREELHAMVDVKWHYLKNFLSRCGGSAEKGLQFHLEKFKGLEQRARSAYHEDLSHIPSDEFVEMMLLDACFLVETFLTHGNSVLIDDPDHYEVENPLISSRTSWLQCLLSLDILMLENQVPFFLLQELFDSITRVPDGDITRLPDLIFHFFRSWNFFPMTNQILNDPAGLHHVLHVFYLYILPNATPSADQQDDGDSSSGLCGSRLLSSKFITAEWLCRCFRRGYGVHAIMGSPRDAEISSLSIPRAVELEQAGVKLVLNDKARSFMEVTFGRGELKIPKLEILSRTSYLIRNFIAFEQCCGEALPGSNKVSNFAALMDCLIETKEDVALLEQNKIVFNGVGQDKEIAHLFNNLCKEVVIDYDNSYLSEVYRDVGKHCNRKVNQWRAKLKHDYLSNPWAIISVLAGIFLLILTVAQTCFAAVSYFRPPPAG